MDRHERTAQVDVDHEVDVSLSHLGEGLVTQDAGIGDQDVDAAEPGHRVVDHLFDASFIRDGRAVCHGFAAQGLDFLDDGLGSGRVAARAIHAGTQIVDNDLCATAGEFECVTPAKAATCTRNDGNAAVKADIGHGRTPAFIRNRFARLHTRRSRKRQAAPLRHILPSRFRRARVPK